MSVELAPEVIARRSYVPGDLDPGDWASLEPLFAELRDRELGSTQDLLRWLADFSELTAAVSEYGSRRRIDRACHTDDPEIERAFLHYVQEIAPRIQPLNFELQKKLLDSPHRGGLTDPKFVVLMRDWASDVDVFREANVPLLTESVTTCSEYDKLVGAMVVEFRGKERTLQQLARFLEDPDRATRQAAWELSAGRRLEDRAAMDSLFDRLLGLRERIAAHADLPGYRDYVWKHYSRFDYTPADCDAFAEAVESVCMPLVAELDRQRASVMGLDRLRPWDLACDPRGRAALEPFDPEDPEALYRGAAEVFGRVGPALAEAFGTLRPGRNLDLDSRPGKRAGGFQSSLEESGEAFIFMNAAGAHRDVETMLHEGGHAFHFLWATAQQPLVFFRHAPMEFCEVASMSMELIGDDFLDVFYPDPADLARARRTHLEGIIRILPWIATIDQFQHWLYTHPGHTAAERAEAWLATAGRFESPVVDWAGYEDARAAMWQKQLHLYHAPFYYIEYGIAQLGALQLWQRYRADPAEALGRYRAALELGGTRPLPELFAAAGLRFDFSSETLGPLIDAVRAELAELPA